MSSAHWEFTSEDGLIHRYVCEWCGESTWLRHYEEASGSWLDEHEDTACENCGHEVASSEEYERPHTYWNGEEVAATPCHVRVLSSNRFPNPWYASHVGEVRSAVKVTREVEIHVLGKPGKRIDSFYLDNEGGQGWQKVTRGHGSPNYGHRSYGAVEFVRAT